MYIRGHNICILDNNVIVINFFLLCVVLFWQMEKWSWTKMHSLSCSTQNLSQITIGLFIGGDFRTFPMTYVVVTGVLVFYCSSRICPCFLLSCRIALVVLDYKDFTLHSQVPTGVNALRMRLLKHLGYKLLQVGTHAFELYIQIHLLVICPKNK